MTALALVTTALCAGTALDDLPGMSVGGLSAAVSDTIQNNGVLHLVLLTGAATAQLVHHGLGRMVLQRSPADAARQLCTMPDFLKFLKF